MKDFYLDRTEKRIDHPENSPVTRKITTVDYFVHEATGIQLERWTITKDINSTYLGEYTQTHVSWRRNGATATLRYWMRTLIRPMEWNVKRR